MTRDSRRWCNGDRMPTYCTSTGSTTSCTKPHLIASKRSRDWVIYKKEYSLSCPCKLQANRFANRDILVGIGQQAGLFIHPEYLHFIIVPSRHQQKVAIGRD